MNTTLKQFLIIVFGGISLVCIASTFQACCERKSGGPETLQNYNTMEIVWQSENNKRYNGEVATTIIKDTEYNVEYIVVRHGYSVAITPRLRGLK